MHVQFYIFFFSELIGSSFHIGLLNLQQVTCVSQTDCLNQGTFIWLDGEWFDPATDFVPGMAISGGEVTK